MYSDALVYIAQLAHGIGYVPSRVPYGAWARVVPILPATVVHIVKHRVQHHILLLTEHYYICW